MIFLPTQPAPARDLFRLVASLLMAAALGCSSGAGPQDEGSLGDVEIDWGPPAQGAEMIGTPAPEWDNGTWVGSEPMRLSDLRGKVVLLRFWTDTCPFCAASAPALAEFNREYASKGLQVIGMYHPKPARAEPPESVAKAAERLGMDFPIALDNDWGTLRNYWLSRGKTWTSVSFLIDKKGTIRHIHPGGAFHRGSGEGHPRCGEVCEQEFNRMRRWIERLLEEDAGGESR